MADERRNGVRIEKKIEKIINGVYVCVLVQVSSPRAAYTPAANM